MLCIHAHSGKFKFQAGNKAAVEVTKRFGKHILELGGNNAILGKFCVVLAYE